jgi:rhodanese-related sulfurtransferase
LQLDFLIFGIAKSTDRSYDGVNDAFAKGHVKGALNIPHGEMTPTRMAECPKDKLFVVYCAGPHCNGANKAALRLARLGLPVKMMIGGVMVGSFVHSVRFRRNLPP